MLAVIDDDPTGAQDEADVPVVEYARDGAFSYRTARLLDWAQERSGGFFAATRGRELHVEADARGLAEERDAQVNFASGRGRASAFVPGPARFGVPIECTEFKFEEDVDGNRGWLDD